MTNDEEGLVSHTRKQLKSGNEAKMRKWRRYFSWSVAALCLILIMFDLVLPTTKSTITEEDSELEAKKFECSEYNDDSVYTNATCGSYDRAACNELCTDSWCLELCEDACASGAGAICATSYLSMIENLCNTLDVEAIPTKKLMGTEPYGHIGSEDVNKADASGCDHHIYCLYCDHTCRSLLREDDVESSLGELHGDTSVGPHSMNLLSRLPELCS